MLVRLAAALVLGAGVSPRGEVGKLTVLIGTIEVKPSVDAEYKPLAAGASVEEGSWIRTAEKSKATINFGDGTELRINEKTELVVEKPRQIDFKTGQVYVRMTGGPLFVIKTPYAPVDATTGIFDLYFNPKDENFPVAPGKPITLVRSLEGRMTIHYHHNKKILQEHCHTGHVVSLVGGTCNTPERDSDKDLACPWIYDLLVARNPHPPELKERLDRLAGKLLNAGDTKAAEQTLKAAGEAAVPSLAEVLKLLNPKDPLNAEPRRKAARILSEVAGLKTAEVLKTMIQDQDGEIRALGAKGQARLAGK